MDSMDYKVPYDGQTVLEREMEKMMTAARKLRDDTGASFSACVAAIDYAGENRNLAVAYLKARGLAVCTPNMPFDERVKYFYEIEERRNKTKPEQECQCVYGIVYEYGNESELTKEHMENEYLGSPSTATKEYLQNCLDRRKGYASHYNYCPYCGQKLDYREVKKWLWGLEAKK